MNIINFRDIIDQYELFLFDLWGVIHDGTKLYPGVMDTIELLHNKNKIIKFISNAPRRAHEAALVLKNLGIESHLYSDIITSGEVCYKYLRDNWSGGKKYFFMGQEKDKNMIEDLGFYQTSIKDADFIANHGYFGDKRDDDISTILQEAKALNINMLCINPDIKVVKQSGETLYCAGKIAASYKEMGGEVIYFGKPYADIYKAAIYDGNMSIHNLSSILAIGDSFYTDILGANQFGIDSCLVTCGIFNDKIGVQIEEHKQQKNFRNLCEQYGAKPKYIIHGF